MQKHSDKKINWLPVLAMTLVVSGCAPVPPPPVSPELFSLGFWWLIVGLLLWIGIIGWEKYGSSKPPKTDYLSEALNAINRRLTILEEQIELLKKKAG